MRLAAVVIPVVGLVIAGVSFITRRDKKHVKLGPITTIDPTLPVEEQERLVRQVLLGVQPAETASVTAGSQAARGLLPFTPRSPPIPPRRPARRGRLPPRTPRPLLP